MSIKVAFVWCSLCFFFFFYYAVRFYTLTSFVLWAVCLMIWAPCFYPPCFLFCVVWSMQCICAVSFLLCAVCLMVCVLLFNALCNVLQDLVLYDYCSMLCVGLWFLLYSMLLALSFLVCALWCMKSIIESRKHGVKKKTISANCTAWRIILQTAHGTIHRAQGTDRVQSI